MTSALRTADASVTRDAIVADMQAACASIAPAWPLDRLIAVNPWWAFVDRPIAQAASELHSRGGVHMLMSRAWFREQWAARRFTTEHVSRAIELEASALTVADVLATLNRDDVPPARRRVLTDVIDEQRDLTHEMSWSEFVTRSLSQACAAFFDEGQSRWMPDRTGGLYAMWRDLAMVDRGPRLLMGLRDYRKQVAALPESPRELIAMAVNLLRISPTNRESYFAGLLLTVNGWASTAAFRRWEARLQGSDDDSIEQLLAARLAWEVILLRSIDAGDVLDRWSIDQRMWPLACDSARASQESDWIMQRAIELSYQDALVPMLRDASESARVAESPSVQAVFCIDVRSEVYRRALEEVAPSAQTRGFAGFFGLPIAFRPVAGPSRPQLPGLLAPTLAVSEVGEGRVVATRHTRRALALQAAIKDFTTTASSAFSAVESTGLLYAAALVRDGFALNRPTRDPLLASRSVGGEPLRMELQSSGSDPAVDRETRVTLAAGVLTAMGLTRDFAPIVAMIGHGAGTENNPQACGLHCGACGGQTGEINARALASLLNDNAVRAGLVERGIVLDQSTQVVAGLHNTTTDDITLFDRDLVPGTHRDVMARFRTQLDAASTQAREERAPRLGITPGEDLHAAVQSRATDWSEVRPEWGLARNAAFIVAPRARTRGRNLDGRAFLHDYDCDTDTGYAVLEGIMTAPMLVTHWINMQYWASTVDNVRYGSGNKVLHNVVGGRVGVLEGAAGDLRIGLALQSVHDGRAWVHDPLRLSVFIEAPASAIDRILERHRVVRDLVLNDWLFLFRIEPHGREICQRRRDGWHTR